MLRRACEPDWLLPAKQMSLSIELVVMYQHRHLDTHCQVPSSEVRRWTGGPVDDCGAMLIGWMQTDVVCDLIVPAPDRAGTSSNGEI